jgi:hypothetical protein
VKRTSVLTVGSAALFLLVLAPPGARASAGSDPSPAAPIETATVGTAPAGLPAVLQRTAVSPVKVEDRSGYNTDYFFGMTRAVADSTLTPALKPVVFLFTLPLDVVFLPFAAIGGFFG